MPPAVNTATSKDNTTDMLFFINVSGICLF
jgi:hypothetical protein